MQRCRTRSIFLVTTSLSAIFALNFGCFPKPNLGGAKGGDDTSSGSTQNNGSAGQGSAGQGSAGQGSAGKVGVGGSGSGGSGVGSNPGGGAGVGSGTGGAGDGGVGTGGVGEGGGMPTGEMPGEPAECKPGDPTECFALPDGTPIMFPGGVPQGNCKAGQRSCVDGKWTACEGAVAPVEKDNCDVPGDDANCDGSPNQGCDCVVGVDKPRRCGETNVGACDYGEQECKDGKWGECVGDIAPSKEICDGKADEDCDGKEDEDDEDCECINGNKETCQDTTKVGRCRIGQRVCTDGKWGRCKSVTRPKPETCNLPKPIGDKLYAWETDENCDGYADNQVALGIPGPKGCDRYMVDLDKDGWGAKGMKAENPRATMAMFRLKLVTDICICPVAKPRLDKAWVPYNPKTAGRDCGDCDLNFAPDGDQVYPGSGNYKAYPSRCLIRLAEENIARNEFFDYNCNGRFDVHPDDVKALGGGKRIYCDEECNTRGSHYAPHPGDTKFFCGKRYNPYECVWEEERGYDGDDEDGTEDKEPKKKKCVIRPAPRLKSVTVRCG